MAIARLSSLFLVLLMLSSLPAATVRAELLYGQGRLWEVRDGFGGAPSHVFGTLHSDEPAVLDLPAHVERAFARSERFAFELDFDSATGAQMSRAMIDRDPPSLRDQLSAAEWRLARRAAAERGLSERLLLQLEPWALAITLALPRTDPANTLDRVLFKRAQARDAPITALETAEEQIAVFDRMEGSDQLAMLRAVLDLYAEDALGTMFDRIRDAWLRGDIAAIMQMSAGNLAVPDAPADEIFFDRLLDQLGREREIREVAAERDGLSALGDNALRLAVSHIQLECLE